MLDRIASAASSRRAGAAHKPSKRSPRPADVALGASIRIARQAKGMSQGVLGHKLGVTFQQVQKYETGANRVGGSRVIQIAEALGCSVADLFGEAVAAGKTGAASPMLLLIARCEPARRLMVAVQRLNSAKRNAAISDLARSAEQMMRGT